MSSRNDIDIEIVKVLAEERPIIESARESIRTMRNENEAYGLTSFNITVELASRAFLEAVLLGTSKLPVVAFLALMLNNFSACATVTSGLDQKLPRASIKLT